MFEHLSKEALCELAGRLFACLTPAQRRAFLQEVQATPLPEPVEALRSVCDAADRLLAYLEAEEEAIVDRYYNDEFFDEDLDALHADVCDALTAAGAWLVTQQPSEAVTAQIAAMRLHLDAVRGWEAPSGAEFDYDNLPYGDFKTITFDVWEALTGAQGDAAEIARLLVERWPVPEGACVLDAALGASQAEAVRAQFHRLAGEGVAAAARWLLHGAPGDPALLAAWAHLDPRIGAAWTADREAAGDWQAITDGARRGVVVAEAPLYRAWLAQGEADAAFRVALRSGSSLSLTELWDDAVRLDRLGALRAMARGAARLEARWLGEDEPALTTLPGAGAPSRTALVVAYAVARATRGALISCAAVRPLTPELLHRLGAAPGRHDPARCVEAALSGLEDLIADEVERRSREAYSIAAARWAEHRELCARFAQQGREAGLRERFATCYRRLPAFKDELRRRGLAW